MQMTHADDMREALSCYLDGRLSDRERSAIERHLAGCAACHEELATMRATVDLLRRLPRLPVPRSFALPVTVRRSPIVVALPWMQRLTALAAALLLLVGSVDALGGFARSAAAPAASVARNVEPLARSLAEGGTAGAPAPAAAPAADAPATTRSKAVGPTAAAAMPAPAIAEKPGQAGAPGRASTVAPAATVAAPRPTTAAAQAPGPTVAPAAAPTTAAAAAATAAPAAAAPPAGGTATADRGETIAQQSRLDRALANPTVPDEQQIPPAGTPAPAPPASPAPMPAPAATGGAAAISAPAPPASPTAVAAPALAAAPPPTKAADTGAIEVDHGPATPAPAALRAPAAAETGDRVGTRSESTGRGGPAVVRLIEGALIAILAGAGLLTVLGRRLIS